MTIDWPAKRDSFDKRMVPALIRDLWQGDPATLRFISQDYNIVYRFEAAAQGRYLRICHPVLHPLPEARQVMHFLRFLAINDVSVAAPLPSVSGNFVELLDDGYFASAQEEAPGHEMSLHMHRPVGLPGLGTFTWQATRCIAALPARSRYRLRLPQRAALLEEYRAGRAHSHKRTKADLRRTDRFHAGLTTA